MKNTLPVSQQEHIFPAHLTLVSVTDRKGYITYCNAAFVEVSGYTEEELLGKPHNIIRHPDMPREAFRDLWATGAKGHLWSAIVKNRRKNGDHYWVKAHVTPISDEAGHIKGFMSVRTQPSRADVAAAEKLYAAMRSEAANQRLVHLLHQGQLQYTGLRGWLQKLRQPRLSTQLLLANSVLLSVLSVSNFLLPWQFALIGIPLTTWLILAQSRRLIHRPLRTMYQDMVRMAGGDLSGKVTEGGQGIVGELQQALVQLQVNTRTVIQDVRHESDTLHDIIEEIVAGNHDLSSRTESAAGNLEKTAASIEELSSTVEHSTETAQNGAIQSRQTADIAQHSHIAVQAVADTMQQILESSRRISDITQLIEGVAFQTNILALNASVEAARAGDSGRGFAVVAAEVRSLAQRASEATKEIKQLIGESSERVRTGTAQATEARNRMQEALAAVQTVAVVLDQISDAANQQRSGIVQVSDVITHLDSVTQQNAAMVEQLTATADSMRTKSGSVNNSMRLFRLRAKDVSLAELGYKP